MLVHLRVAGVLILGPVRVRREKPEPDHWLGKESSLELRFHPEQQASRQGNLFLANGKRLVLQIEPLTTEGVQFSAGAVPLPGRHGGKESTLLTVRLRTQRQRWRNAVALSWCPVEDTPKRVALRAKGRRWIFSVRDRKLVLDWETL